MLSIFPSLDTGRLFICGEGSFGQLGNGDIQSCNVPSEVAFFSSKHVEVEEIACGIRHTLALVNGKTLLCSELNHIGACNYMYISCGRDKGLM